jgi:enolase-phosphatase E1
VRVYSSGSVQAQQLFFGHTICGDLLPLLAAHYDTAVGPKKDPASYGRIVEAFGRPAKGILLASDQEAELDAARAAGMRTVLCQRPGNPPSDNRQGHPVCRDFNGLPEAVSAET